MINGKDFCPPIDLAILDLPEAEQKLAASPTRSPTNKKMDHDSYRSELKEKIHKKVVTKM
jgi:hypothetical protein